MVDAGHTCVSGYNEVVMLGRIREEEKKKVMSTFSREGETDDPLHELPHMRSKVRCSICGRVCAVWILFVRSN